MTGARLLIWSPLSFFMLVGIGVSTQRSPLYPLGFVALIAALTAPKLSKLYTQPDKEQWRPLYAAVQPRVDRDTLILAATRQELIPLRYYFERKTHPLPALPVIVNPDSPLAYEPDMIGGDRTRALQRIAAAHHIFVLDRRRGSRSKQLLQQLLARGKLLSTVYFERLRVDEIVMNGASRRLLHLPPLQGTGKIDPRRYFATRRER